MTTHLRRGYVASDAWSPSLDGILAYWALQEQFGEEEFALGMTGHRPLVEVDLPLARADDGVGVWWWVCSSPLVSSDPARHDRWFHRRFDGLHAPETISTTTKTVLVKGGPYKSYRNRETVTLPADGCLRWHCVGDAGEIRRLLRRCTHVGRGGARGGGEVIAWTVEAGGDETIARQHRPLPVAAAIAAGVSGPVLRWGLRPPGRAPEHQVDCVMP